MLEEHDFSLIVCRELGLWTRAPELGEWRALVDRIKGLEKEITIGIVGKYVQLHDAYLSVAEALHHAGYENNCKVNIAWIDSEGVTKANVAEKLKGLAGVIVPGGFGNRGIEGKIETARYCRENDLPYLGICLGMQIAVIEFARSVLGWKDANSGEFDPDSKHKVIDFLPDQSDEINKGGTLRLGAYPCKTVEGTLMRKCYGTEMISERHRHRYEFNNDFRDELIKAGLTVSGMSPDERIVETVEIKENRFFVGVQFHPEFKSRPNKAHPLFSGLIKAALNN